MRNSYSHARIATLCRAPAQTVYRGRCDTRHQTWRCTRRCASARAWRAAVPHKRPKTLTSAVRPAQPQTSFLAYGLAAASMGYRAVDNMCCRALCTAEHHTTHYSVHNRLPDARPIVLTRMCSTAGDYADVRAHYHVYQDRLRHSSALRQLPRTSQRHMPNRTLYNVLGRMRRIPCTSSRRAAPAWLVLTPQYKPSRDEMTD